MPQFQRRPMAAAILMMFSAAPAALAQTKPEQTLPEVKVQGAPEQPGFRTETTRGATRTETPLRDIPQFINSVPQELIRSQGATTLQDALRNVPGISYAAAEGGTQANQVFYLRGFPAGGDLFIDGLRDLGEYNRDLFFIDSVEVLKGSSSLTFGRGSTGGVINQTSKLANLGTHKEIGLTFGSFDQKRLAADLNLKMNDSNAVRLVVMGEKSGSYRYPQDVDKIGFAPSVLFGISDRTKVTLSHMYLKTNDVTDYGQPALFTAGAGFFGFPPVSPKAYYGYANHDFAEHETNITTLKLDHAFSDKVSLRNMTRAASYRREMEATISTLRATDINGAAVTAATPASLLVVTRNHDSGRTRNNDDTALINQTELTWKLSTGSVNHTILGGLELAREKLDRSTFTLDGNPATVAVDAPTSITPLLAPNPYTLLSYSKRPNQNVRANGDTVALYVQDQLEFSTQWKALFGLRWERFKADTYAVTLATGAVANTFSRTDEMLSGRAGLIWQPTDRQSYYVSYGNSYNPSGELGVYGATGTNLSAINQNLDPEKNSNVEVGAQWEILRGLQLRSAIFRNEKENARMVDPVSGATVLAGVRRVEGVEFELAGSITPKWDIYSGIAFMDGKIVTGPANVVGRTPLGVADVTGNVWTVYRLGGGWEIGGGVRGQKDTWLTDANQTGSQIPKYLVADAMVGYVQKQYEIRLNLYNLADKTYYTGGYNNNPNRVLPGMPRAAMISLNYRFN